MSIIPSSTQLQAKLQPFAKIAAFLCSKMHLKNGLCQGSKRFLSLKVFKNSFKVIILTLESGKIKIVHLSVQVK